MFLNSFLFYFYFILFLLLLFYFYFNFWINLPTSDDYILASLRPNLKFFTSNVIKFNNQLDGTACLHFMPHVQCQLDCEHSTSKEDTFRFKTIQLPRLHGIHDLSRKGRSKDFDLILSNLASASASIGNSGSGTTTPSSSTVHHQPSSIEGKRGRKLVTSLATKVMILVVAATLLALVASALSTPTPLLLVFLRRLHRPC